jgi:hypothetical protein
MSRKHYRKIAATFAAEVTMIRHLSDSDAKRSAAYSVRNLILSLADVLRADNDRFRRDAFYEACGLTYGKDGWQI